MELNDGPIIASTNVLLQIEKPRENEVRIIANGDIYQHAKGVWTRLGKVVGGKGANGVDGKNGKNGKDGKDGKDGKTPANGKNGRDGRDGKDGRNGTDGKNGKDGQQGPRGPAFNMSAYLASADFGKDLKKTDPKVEGQLWNNKGVLSISKG